MEEVFPKLLFKSKDNDICQLGLGETQIFNNTFDLKALNSLLIENKELTIMGGQRFTNATDTAHEWNAFKNRYYFIPSFLITQNLKNKYCKISLQIHNLRANFSNEYKTMLRNQFLTIVENSLTNTEVDKQLKVTQGKKSLTKNNWHKVIHTINQMLDEKDDSLEKVVMAQRKHYKILNEHTYSFINNFFSSNYNNYNLVFTPEKGSLFLSATPEKLFSIKDNTLEIEAIAGTVNNTDANFKAEITCQKIENEHQYVKTFISHALDDLGVKACWDVNNTTLKLADFSHLYSKHKSKHCGVNVFALLNKLQPTPAVAGIPQEKSIQVINAYEGFDRGYYAGSFGIFSLDHSDCLVAIRSCLIKDQDLYTYAGCGIVSGSDSFKELKESELKFHNVAKHLLIEPSTNKDLLDEPAGPSL